MHFEHYKYTQHTLTENPQFPKKINFLQILVPLV